jgi:hypothetical protein
LRGWEFPPCSERTTRKDTQTPQPAIHEPAWVDAVRATTATVDREGSVLVESVTTLRDAGLRRAATPVEYGGAGLAAEGTGADPP